jgi:hypothetical protein
LPWLKEMVADFSTDSLASVKIYQCTYQNSKIGFLIERFVGSPDGEMELYNCEGDLLCILFGIDGSYCPEYAVDLHEKIPQLIYQHN